MISTDETEKESEAVSRCVKEDLTHSFEEVLKDLPEVLLYIQRLNEHIKKQQCTLVKLYEKLKEYKSLAAAKVNSCHSTKDSSTQTENQDELAPPTKPTTESQDTKNDQCSEWSVATGATSGTSLADEVKRVAENAVQQSGFVYEETSGMYYDYSTGYYYNAEMGLYYDGNSGTYLFYNEATKSYQYHSHAAVPQITVPQAAIASLSAITNIPAPQAAILQAAILQAASQPAAASQSTASLGSVISQRVSKITPPVPALLKAKDSRAVADPVVAPPKILSRNKVAEAEAKLPLRTKVAVAEPKVSSRDKRADAEPKASSRMKEAEAERKVSSRTKKVEGERKHSSRVKVDEAEPKVSSRNRVAEADSKVSMEVEDDLHIPGSNPMAPVLLEPSNISTKAESRNEHKRKGKHKKHKSKKKKKKRHRSISRSENSVEEGECSESDVSEADRVSDEFTTCSKNPAKKKKKDYIEIIEDLPDPEPYFEEPLQTISQNWKMQRRFSDEASEAWPPCMRIIVQSTDVKNLSVGTLFIVTCKGGTLGREKFHAVSIPDINISKHHGKFTFDESDGGKYYLTDYGSRNGTYIDNQRLSSAKQESEPFEIPHGTVVSLGSTNLLCHIHPGRETCEECEPGVVAAKKADDCEREHMYSACISGESKSVQRKQELRRLRKRFGLESNESKAELLAPGYEDRAEIRRVTVGSHNEHAKTETASTTESIRSTNKGFKMLSKMGWKAGESLGRDGTGLTEPVLVTQRADKAGLGADNSFALTATSAKGRTDKWQLARQRYGQLPDTVRDEGDDGDDVEDEEDNH